MTRWRPGAPGGQPGAYSTSINGFGGIRLLVEARPAPYLNGELMRGFGLTIDGVERFRTTQSIDMGGATVSRSVYVNTSANWGRWLDTFTNTTKAPVTIRVAFGRPSGQGTTGATTSAIVATSSGDAVVTPEDAWVEYATPLLASTLVGGRQVTVLGTPSPFSGAMTFAGNWLYDSFDTPLAYSGHERNFQAYVNTLTLPPRTSLASNPPLGDLSAAELCSVANFDIAAMSVPGFNHASCSARKLALVQQPPVPRQKVRGRPPSSTTSSRRRCVSARRSRCDGPGQGG